jgi:hypothetical protein
MRQRQGQSRSNCSLSRSFSSRAVLALIQLPVFEGRSAIVGCILAKLTTVGTRYRL